MSNTISSNPPLRLLAIDLDGTLLNDRKSVSDPTLRALRDLARRDVRIIIASARPPRSVRHIYSALELDTLQINYNGALIWDEPNKTVMYHRPLDPQLVRRIIDQARDMYEEVLVTCEILDRWYTDRFDLQHTTETGRLFRPDVVCPIDEICNQPITKLLLLGEPRIILRLEPLLIEAHASQVTLVRTDDDLLQIMHRSVSKAAALRAVAKHYNVPLEQIMAIGDAPNDVGMLQLARISVAMENAHPLAKQVADWIAPSNNDDGVYAALKRYGLCE